MLNETEHSFPLDPEGFFRSFEKSLTMIIAVQIGDKTFLYAAIMAMKHSKVAVFCGNLAALSCMTVVESLFGYAANVIPKDYIKYAAMNLFFLFGLKMMYDGWKMPTNPAEMDEEEFFLVDSLQSVKSADETRRNSYAKEAETPAVSMTLTRLLARIKSALTSGVFVTVLTMTFLAEWGDRSQIATVMLAASENVLGVCVGCILAHTICGLMSVLGGKMISKFISVRTVTIIGGIVFLYFGVSTFETLFPIQTYYVL